MFVFAVLSLKSKILALAANLRITKNVIVFSSRSFQLKFEMSNIMKGMIVNYTGLNRTTEHTWDYVQRTVS